MARNPLSPHRAQNLKQRYNLTLQDFDELLVKQSNACAICFKPFPYHVTPFVDHSHSTGIVRGLLCTHCNLAIGHLRDFPEVAEAAASYLRKHE